jgi:hypothetical protein
MSEVTVSAKDKKKDKTDRDKRSQNRSVPDKEKEDIEEAIKESQRAERKIAKEKKREQKELAKVLEQSRLEAERGAKELQALSSKPIVPTPLLILGKQNLFVSDKHGNVHVPASRASYEIPFDPVMREKDIGKKRDKRVMLSDTLDPRLIMNISDARKEDPSSDAPPHSFPSVHLSESKDSKVHDGHGSESSKGLHASESKDTVADLLA